uniref:FAST kinase domains 1 n=1 Tax=Chrysemys picta bellii TaxID=8478 RepID=A0A8C3FHN1_CHRPI|nr:FAST kinase domain-containing protein 1, mitochondrial isoform X1 [Chrysemys picta bellii]XP_008176640.1 FAST kinase domain-containing protein 1, mitochondrial isoform X1 [Chrysemys picta bellii]XP_008176641.1 FAST kinase domain-containing protein 1, mitochondrial isoform X1 [Chrysemys picta bellii]XP_023970587.1 FAST kinase domain-containing protein 1, mitochondrial isoform X1 [Chrysemys picta bellii]XP_023970589.1 FAST kinase domain-containing protein 1, mitochondrial isoform X1 [Chrysemys
MLCVRHICAFALRRCQFRTLSSDTLLRQLNSCTTEDQVFDLVGKNKARLSEKHVGTAISQLWNFQKDKSRLLRSIDYVKNHSQFLTLRILAENKIEFMDDDLLVDTLYSVLRFTVEAHDSLVEELVVEAWRRLERFSLPTLSRFAVCLNEQQIYFSPLIGKIADIVNMNLDSTQDIRVLLVLMVSISGVISQSFQEQLIQKAELLLETENCFHFNHARKMVHFLRNVRLTHRPLLDKCNKIFLKNLRQLDLESISHILTLYQTLQFNNTEFRLVVKQKLTETIDDCINPVSFTKLFAALGPMAGPEVRERLIATALLMAEEFNCHEVLVVVETMEKMECRNSHLIQKIASLLHKYLDKYKPLELAKITQALLLLHCHNAKLYTKLRGLVVGYLQVNVVPRDISMLTRILSMLPSSQVDEVVINRVDAVLSQCKLNDLNSFATALVRWVHRDQSRHQSTSGPSAKLLQKLSNCGYQRLQKASDLDLLLEECRYLSGEWFEEILVEETVNTCQRLMDQITWMNVQELSTFLLKTNYRCTPLLDRIASVAVQHINKIHPSGMYAILRTFTVLNYDPPQSEEFFETCIQHCSSQLDCFEPHILVLLGYSLAVAEYFPPALINAIFNVDFLAKLDAQLEIPSDTLNWKVRLRLMELNRAVCLECPEFQIPWFHERYCQQMQRKGNRSTNTAQQQIRRMLGEILGGSQYAKVSVLTPYYYGIDFEFILDKNKKPLPYMDQSIVLADLVQWGPDIQLLGKKGLPPGAQRIAVEFLDSKAFCKNSCQLNGEIAMKKRHLEILGYQVVQIPHFEWNSMELSSKDAWMEYLKKSIFETK